jgi:HAD superfamily hydrolase (TIGR01509 family)
MPGGRAGVLFDVDGTLVDTSYLHTVTWWEAMREHGYDVAMARIHRAVGMGSDKLVDHVLGADRDRDRDDEVKAAHLALYATYWERLRPLPGAADLLRAVSARDLRVVLASSASERELDVLRKVIGADDAIDETTSASDAGTSKPDPEILQVALRRGGLAPARAVLVGDSVWDVIAAGRVGLRCIGLTCGGICAAELREAGAVETYENPAALLAALDRSAIGELSRV